MKGLYTMILLTALLAALPGQAWAQDAAEAPPESFVADVTVAPDAVQFTIDGEYVGFVMEVAGPDEFYLHQSFAGDETPVLPLKTAAQTLADGAYTIQVTAQPHIPPDARAALADARQRGDRAAIQKTMTELGIDRRAMVFSVNLGIADGQFINPEAEEWPAEDAESIKGADAGDAPKSTIRLTGRRLEATFEPAGIRTVAPPDATGTATDAFLDASEMPQETWYEVVLENTAEDGTPVRLPGYIRPVPVEGTEKVFEIRVRTSEDGPWQHGYFRADRSGVEFMEPGEDALFDYVTDEQAANHEADHEAGMPFFHIGSGSIDGSLCVGNDCLSNENFGFDTIRMKENNLRLHYDDTSTTASFPQNDWRVYANDSANGGSSYYGVEDATAGRFVFRVFAGAPANALTVDSQGDVGLQTTTPAVDIDVKKGDSPTLRLQQDGTSGFTPQTWDVAGNEANFFIRDVTNGSLLPFKIRPSSPTNSIVLESSKVNVNQSGVNLDFQVEGDNEPNLLYVDASTDNVGIGTDSPTGRLQVESTGTNTNVILARRSGTVNTIFRVFEDGAGNANLDVRTAAGARAVEMTGLGGGRLSVGCNTPQNDLDLGNDPTSTCATVATRSFINAGSTTFTASSSRLLKTNILPLRVEGILDRILQVGVYEYDFIDGPEGRLGLMAEDFHTIFGRGSDKLLEGQEVDMALWLAVQELTLRNQTLEAQNQVLMERLDRIEALLGAQDQ